MKSGASNIKQPNGENKKTLADKNTFEIEQSKNELTIEKLKTYKDFEIIKKLAKILHCMFMNEQQMNNNQSE
jgi:hexokinase